mmetsp:Transcript_28934/g.74277  ORF Transcript_28934/g.74277 Transcript_28934/m.74277 type:complete len:153 (+) Transcript_28934:2814-3272(+)
MICIAKLLPLWPLFPPLSLVFFKCFSRPIVQLQQQIIRMCRTVCFFVLVALKVFVQSCISSFVPTPSLLFSSSFFAPINFFIYSVFRIFHPHLFQIIFGLFLAFLLFVFFLPIFYLLLSLLYFSSAGAVAVVPASLSYSCFFIVYFPPSNDE